MAEVRPDDIDHLLETYREELYQFRYNSEYVTSQQKRKRTDAANERVLARQFKRLDDMTVTDEDIPNEDD